MWKIGIELSFNRLITCDVICLYLARFTRGIGKMIHIFLSGGMQFLFDNL